MGNLRNWIFVLRSIDLDQTPPPVSEPMHGSTEQVIVDEELIQHAGPRRELLEYVNQAFKQCSSAPP